eukprot:scaffold310959_cov14-Tisochrysis_lutea.AAC.2
MACVALTLFPKRHKAFCRILLHKLKPFFLCIVPNASTRALASRLLPNLGSRGCPGFVVVCRTNHPALSSACVFLCVKALKHKGLGFGHPCSVPMPPGLFPPGSHLNHLANPGGTFFPSTVRMIQGA